MEKTINLKILTQIQTSFLICLTLMFIHGCTLFHVPQQRNEETAEQCLKRIWETNELLVSCKGIAKINVYGFDFQLNERIAFISQKSHQLRAEMLSPFGVIGTPFQLICNQNQIYLNSRFLDKPIYTRPGAFLLNHALPIQIQPQELIACLHGQLPISKQMTAYFDSQSEQKILIRSKGLIRKTIGIVFLDSSATHVRSFEKYHFNKLIFRVTFDQYQTYQNFSVPSKLTFSNTENQYVTLEIQSYYPNCAIKKNPFYIDNSEHSEKGGFPCLPSGIINPIRTFIDIF